MAKNETKTATPATPVGLTMTQFESILTVTGTFVIPELGWGFVPDEEGGFAPDDGAKWRVRLVSSKNPSAGYKLEARVKFSVTPETVVHPDGTREVYQDVKNKVEWRTVGYFHAVEVPGEEEGTVETVLVFTGSESPVYTGRKNLKGWAINTAQLRQVLKALLAKVPQK